VTGLKLVASDPREVDATIAVNANTPVRADTQVSLEFQGLTGVPVVTLSGGSPDAPLLRALPGQPPRLIASEAAGQTMSEAARQVLGRIDKILSENSGNLHSMIANLSSFSEALGRNSNKVDGILGGLERMTGGAAKPAGPFYDLTAVSPPAQPLKPLGQTLAVPELSALAVYDTDKPLAQLDGGELAPLGEAKWSDSLPKLIQARIIQSFENFGSLGKVSRPAEELTADYQLLIEIRRFQLVLDPAPAASAEISAKLAASDGRVIAARIFDARVSAKSGDAADAAKALNEAFGKIESALITWTAGTTASAGEKPRLPGSSPPTKRRS
jgi:phospholipid/cholesterol/gamma-HCH transport system substrate-binding protein